MASQYGRKLNPYRRLRDPLGVKGIRQNVVVTNNPSTIDQNQQLLVRFPNLGPNDVVVPGTAKLAFTIALTSTDPNRTVVRNLGRAVIKKKAVKIEGNEVLSVDDSDVFDCYTDLWKTAPERKNSEYQGIASTNVLALRVEAGDAVGELDKDKAVSDAYGNRFFVPLDFELLESHMPFYQAALADRLSYELTFNDYSRVIKAAGDSEARYTITGISLEYEMVTNPDLARMIRQQYQGKLAVYYDRILRHRKMTVNKDQTVWNINLNTPATSMKGILMIFEDPSTGGASYSRDPEKFYNPKIKKVEVTIEGVPNQLYAHGMLPYQQFEEIRKHFASGKLHAAEVGHVAKDLHLSDVTVADYLTSKYALWLDMRSNDDDSIHGSGRRIMNGSEGMTIQITKKQETTGALNMYLYVVMDGQLNIENGRFVQAIY